MKWGLRYIYRWVPMLHTPQYYLVSFQGLYISYLLQVGILHSAYYDWQVFFKVNSIRFKEYRFFMSKIQDIALNSFTTPITSV